MAKTIGNLTIGYVIGLACMFFLLKQCDTGMLGNGEKQLLTYDSSVYKLIPANQDHKPERLWLPKNFLPDSAKKIAKKGQKNSRKNQNIRRITSQNDTLIQVDTSAILNQVDTAAILNRANEIQDLLDYYRYREYSKTLRDSQLRLNYKIGINQNKLDTFQADYRILRPKKTITPVKNSLWANVNLDYTDVEAGLSYQWGQYKAGLNYKVLTRRELNPMERVELNLSMQLYETR